MAKQKSAYDQMVEGKIAEMEENISDVGSRQTLGDIIREVATAAYDMGQQDARDGWADATPSNRREA